MGQQKRRKRRGFDWRFWQIIGVSLLTVVVGGLVIQALQPVAAPVAAETRVPVPQASDFATDQPALPTALFIGDSYTHGTGASNPSLRWSTLVATARGWTEVNEANGGTGYIANASKEGCGLDFCPNYSGVLDGLTIDQPDVVLIAGGQNDFRSFQEGPAAATEAIAAVYAKARTMYPDARIIAVGPSVLGGTISDTVWGFDGAVQAAAAAVGAEYVSLLDPNVLADPAMELGDGGHVNDLGHRAIADRVLTLP